MEAGMDMDFSGSKADRRCCRVENHCCTHPVGIDGSDKPKLKTPAIQGGALFAQVPIYASIQ
jgi:hypothetical protein